MSTLILQADATKLPLAEQCVDMVFGSPPYCERRTYDDGTIPAGHVISRKTAAWVDWMLDVTTESVRVCRGPVLWVIGCPTKSKNYQPAAEGLLWEWHRRGGHSFRPVYWHRYGIPGSGGRQWFRADIEYVLAFKHPGDLPWSDNTAMGKPPKFAPGGAFSNRNGDGRRANEKKAQGGKWKANRRRGNGEREPWDYVPPKLANPGNLIRTGAAGGGHLGDKIAHENEAPFPEKLAEHFIRSLCPPGGTVLDPFSGSGTTAKVANVLGRNAIAIDLRRSQVELTRRRTAVVQPELLTA